MADGPNRLTLADWDPARAPRLGQDWPIARYYQGDWPSARGVIHHFGSFADAATASGLVARRAGGQHEDRTAARAANRAAVARRSPSRDAPGVEQLGECLSALASARKHGDPLAMHAALVDLAGAALAWADTV